MQFALLYLDDVVIFSGSIEKYVDHIKSMLALLSRPGVSVNLNKCFFFEDWINKWGPVKESIDLVYWWKRPNWFSGYNIVRKRLNSSGPMSLQTFRRFVPNFEIIVAPLSLKLELDQLFHLWILNECSRGARKPETLQHWFTSKTGTTKNQTHVTCFTVTRLISTSGALYRSTILRDRQSHWGTGAVRWTRPDQRSTQGKGNLLLLYGPSYCRDCISKGLDLLSRTKESSGGYWTWRTWQEKWPYGEHVGQSLPYKLCIDPVTSIRKKTRYLASLRP